MKRYRNLAGVVVRLPDDDTATRLLGKGWVGAEASEEVPASTVPPKRKPGRPKKEASSESGA